MVLNSEILGRWSDKFWAFFLAIVLLVASYVLIALGFGGIARAFLTTGEMRQLIGGEFALAKVLFFALMMIGVAHLSLWLVMAVIYRRSYYSLINPYKLSLTQDFKIGALFLAAYFLVSEIAGLLLGGGVGIEFVWQFGVWWLWLLPIAVAVLLQTSAEELVFRGFLQQYLARFVAQKWFYIGLPALLWALLHFTNFEGEYLPWAVVFSTFIFGIILGDWADRRKSLAGPIAIHFLNNFVLMAIYGNDLEPTEMQILRAGYAHLSEGWLVTYILLGTALMVAVYAFFRPRFVQPISYTNTEDEVFL